MSNTETDSQVAGTRKLPATVMLKLENLNLKLQNVQLQLQLMNQQLGQAMEARDRLRSEMESLRTEIIKTYDVDIATAQISSDGTIQPQRTNGGQG